MYSISDVLLFFAVMAALTIRGLYLHKEVRVLKKEVTKLQGVLLMFRNVYDKDVTFDFEYEE